MYPDGRITTMELDWAEERYFWHLSDFFEGIYIDLINGVISCEEAVNQINFKGREVV